MDDIGENKRYKLDTELLKQYRLELLSQKPHPMPGMTDLMWKVWLYSIICAQTSPDGLTGSFVAEDFRKATGQNWTNDEITDAFKLLNTSALLALVFVPKSNGSLN